MKRVINFISKNHNYKMIIGLVAGSLIASTTTYAITVASNTVTYDNTNSGQSFAYWTMNVLSSRSYAWLVRYNGHVNNNIVTETMYGARAVIEINK